MLILSELLSLGNLDFVLEVKNTFLAINKSQTGEIVFEELKEFIRNVHPDTKEAKLIEIFDSIDHDQSGLISYSEFLCALAYIEQLNEKNLQKVFKFLDVEN
jgi:Ca2+-binding EF-hand superfamily protein